MQVFILLHTVDDREVAVNTAEIVSMTRPAGLVTQDANCLIGLTDGKFLTTMESCREVIEMIKEKQP